MKNLIIAFTAVLLMNSSAEAKEYFRLWQGFRAPPLKEEQFFNKLPSFMNETVALYGRQNQILNSYLVVIPPKEKPNFVPDEFALVVLSSEEKYREIRQTEAGKKHSERPWDLFDRHNSMGAREVVEWEKQIPETLTSGSAHWILGKGQDWNHGYVTVFLGYRRPQVTETDFLMRMREILLTTKKTMQPMGLNGYIVLITKDYEIAFFNWESKELHDKAAWSNEGLNNYYQSHFLLKRLMYTEPQKADKVDSVESNQFWQLR
jgi:hypothetical protein